MIQRIHYINGSLNRPGGEAYCSKDNQSGYKAPQPCHKPKGVGHDECRKQHDGLSDENTG